MQTVRSLGLIMILNKGVITANRGMSHKVHLTHPVITQHIINLPLIKYTQVLDSASLSTGYQYSSAPIEQRVLN